MSSKGEQIVARLFLKVALLVSDARTTARDIPLTAGRADKWAIPARRPRRRSV